MPTKIKVTEVIGKSSAVLHSDGLTLYEKLKTSSDDILLSFDGIVHCTTAFLNASIGKFLIENPDKYPFVRFEGFTNENEDIKDKIELVVENARDEKKRISLNQSSRNYFYA